MRLFDIFFHSGPKDRPRPEETRQPPTREDWLRIGRLEAEVASLHLQWESYRDELRRLVQRLDKRDQRAAARAQQEEEAEPVAPVVDAITERVLARRHALRGGARNGVPSE